VVPPARTSIGDASRGIRSSRSRRHLGQAIGRGVGSDASSVAVASESADHVAVERTRSSSCDSATDRLSALPTPRTAGQSIPASLLVRPKRRCFVRVLLLDGSVASQERSFPRSARGGYGFRTVRMFRWR
jgi:hypothetical protein